VPVAVAVNEASVVEAYSYVLDFRAKYNQTQGEEGSFIVATNASFGLDYVHADSMPLWCNMYDSLGKYGILNVAATMNSSENLDVVHDMPTTCPSDYLITVTSTDKDDMLAPNAAFGPTTVDLGAPGVSIMSTYPGDTYRNMTGTSFAAPMVSGAIGLIYASSCQQLTEDAYQYPDSLARAVKRFIMQGVDTVENLEGQTVTGGRLNLYNSLINAENYSDCKLSYVDDPAAIADQFGIISIVPNPASEFINVTYANLKTGNNRFVLTDVAGRKIRTWDDGIKGIGTHQRQFELGDLPAGMYMLRINTGVRQSPLHKFIVR
jgi:hypothetical protein